MFNLGYALLSASVYLITYKMDLYRLSDVGFLSVLGFGLLVIGNAIVRSLFASKIKRPRALLVFGRKSKSGEFALVILLALSVLSILAMGLYGDSEFGSTGYESRYDESRGRGLFLIFMPAFLPYVAYKLINSESRKEFVKYSLIAVALALFVYVVLNGYRQIFAAALLLIGVSALVKRYITPAIIVFGILVIFPVLITALSFLRYIGEEDKAFDSVSEAAFYYIQGDIFPIDAVIKILYHVEAHGPAGFDIFLTHFYRLVPRFFWSDKPDILLNAAGYYTQVVVGYERGVTLSPTIMGEGLLIGGYPGFFVIVFLAGAFASYYDILMLRKFKHNYTVINIILFANMYFGFFMIREGLESALYRFVISMVFAMIAALMSNALRSFSVPK